MGGRIKKILKFRTKLAHPQKCIYKSKNNSHCLFKTHRKFWLVVWQFSVCLTKFSKQHDERRIGPSAFLWITKWSLWPKPESTGATPLASKPKSSERLVSPTIGVGETHGLWYSYAQTSAIFFLFRTKIKMTFHSVFPIKPVLCLLNNVMKRWKLDVTIGCITIWFEVYRYRYEDGTI